MANDATSARLAYVQVNNGRASDAETEFNAQTDFFVKWDKDAADTASATVTTNQPFFANAKYPFNVITVSWLSKAALTLNATSYATIALNRNSGVTSGVGSTMISVAAKSTQSTTIGLRKIFDIPVTTANRTVPVTGCLYVNIAKASAGKKLPSGVLTVHCRRI